jgi:uncharacterized protein (UPF0261 family)
MRICWRLPKFTHDCKAIVVRRGREQVRQEVKQSTKANMKTTFRDIVIIATLDSKGEEAGYLAAALETSGRRVQVLDVGTAGLPSFDAAFSREVVAEEGALDASARGPADRLDRMAAGARSILARLVEEGRVGCVVGLGGGKGAALFHQATRSLPYGFPKLLITSARPALLAEIATTSDMILMPTLVDLFGVNRFTRVVLDNAAAMAAALDWSPAAERGGRTVAITAFGVTTPAVNRIKRLLSEAGIDAVVFPANGAGGRTMEALIARGEFDGVIDLTTTEMADLLLGGTASAGPERLTAAALTGIPQVVAPGAVDMVNFGPPDTVPACLSGRPTYRHTPMTTLVRTTPEDNAHIGRMTAERLNQTKAPAVVIWPAGGVSDYDRPGEVFHDPAANRAWRDAMVENLRPGIPVVESPDHINDLDFAVLCADWMIAELGGAK